MVVAVYTPLHESKNAPGKYCDVLDSLSETAGRLELQFSILSTHMVFVGDWDAHIAHCPCGDVVLEEFW